MYPPCTESGAERSARMRTRVAPSTRDQSPPTAALRGGGLRFGGDLPGQRLRDLRAVRYRHRRDDHRLDLQLAAVPTFAIFEVTVVFVVAFAATALSYFGLGRRFRVFHLIECVIAVVLLVLLAPMIIVICASIKISGRRRLFDRREVEEDGHTYRKLTFQTTPMGSPQDDPLSRLLRRLSLDQLPWLINVARGDGHLPKFTDAFIYRRTPRQRIADLCLADSPQHLNRVLIENARGRLNRLSDIDWLVVHRFHMLTSAIFVTGGTPLDEDWDKGENWHGEMDPFDFEMFQYDDLIEDLDRWPISQAELAEARKVYPLMKEIAHATVAEAHLRARAEHGPGAFRDRRRCDGYGRSRRAGSRERASRGSKSTRVRGSRRIVSRSSAGGASGDDPGGEPEPAPGRQSGQLRGRVDPTPEAVVHAAA
jgi:hypothetical protein